MSTIHEARLAAAGARSARNRISTFLIEGEEVTYPTICERLEITTSQAMTRMSQARKLPGPITWERLRR